MSKKQEMALRAALGIVTGIADDERSEGRVGMAIEIERQIIDALQKPYKCRIKRCTAKALDQLPSEQPSVCASHDPGR